MTRTLPVAVALVGIALGVMPLAQTTPRIVRFEPTGPAGVAWEGRGTSKTHYYYRSAENRNTAAGIWTSPDFAGRMQRATFTEFIYLLQGAITLVDKSGREEVFRPGDALVIPRGTEFQWKKSDDVREYWAIFEREDGLRALPPIAGTPTFFRLSPDGPPGSGLGGSGRTKQHEYLQRRRRVVGRCLGDRPAHRGGISQDHLRRSHGLSQWHGHALDSGWPDRAIHRGPSRAGAKGHRVQVEQRYGAEVLGDLRQRPGDRRQPARSITGGRRPRPPRHRYGRRRLR